MDGDNIGKATYQQVQCMMASAQKHIHECDIPEMYKQNLAICLMAGCGTSENLGEFLKSLGKMVSSIEEKYPGCDVWGGSEGHVAAAWILKYVAMSALDPAGKLEHRGDDAASSSSTVPSSRTPHSASKKGGGCVNKGGDGDDENGDDDVDGMEEEDECDDEDDNGSGGRYKVCIFLVTDLTQSYSILHCKFQVCLDKLDQKEWAELARGMVKQRIHQIKEEMEHKSSDSEDADGEEDDAPRPERKLLSTQCKNFVQLLPILRRMAKWKSEYATKYRIKKPFTQAKSIRAFNNRVSKVHMY